ARKDVTNRACFEIFVLPPNSSWYVRRVYYRL
ncbi:MAG: hypothetical protein ACI8Q3_002685, partial [Marinomonas primoryensis]